MKAFFETAKRRRLPYLDRSNVRARQLVPRGLDSPRSNPQWLSLNPTSHRCPPSFATDCKSSSKPRNPAFIRNKFKKLAKLAHNQKSFTYNHLGFTIILEVRGPRTRIPSEGTFNSGRTFSFVDCLHYGAPSFVHQLAELYISVDHLRRFHVAAIDLDEVHTPVCQTLCIGFQVVDRTRVAGTGLLSEKVLFNDKTEKEVQVLLLVQACF